MSDLSSEMTCPACGGDGRDGVRAVPDPYTGEPTPEPECCAVCEGTGPVHVYPASRDMVPAADLDAARQEAAKLRRLVRVLAVYVPAPVSQELGPELAATLHAALAEDEEATP